MPRLTDSSETDVFFSSRRRHTRLQGDWSSDVCSSDLWGCRIRPAVDSGAAAVPASRQGRRAGAGRAGIPGDRKSTRLNSSHLVISYAVFCLKKKKNANTQSSTNPGAVPELVRD